MIDADFTAGSDSVFQGQDEAADRLLYAALSVSGAVNAYLVKAEDDEIIVHRALHLRDGSIERHPEPDAILGGYPRFIIGHVKENAEFLRSHRASPVAEFARSNGPAEHREAFLCAPITFGDTVSAVLYLDNAQLEDGFSDQAAAAIQLITLASAVGAGGVAPKRKASEASVRHMGSTVEQIVNFGSWKGIDPGVRGNIAQSLAYEINDDLSAVVAHAGAGLHWLGQDPPRVDKALNSFKKIASLAVSVGSTISKHRMARTIDAAGTDETAV